MFRKIEDFATSWTYESASTLSGLKSLTEASLSQRINPEGREIRRLATHITETVADMLHRAGLKFDGPDDLADSQLSAAEIAEKYEAVSKAALEAVTTQWVDANLTEEVEMYGMQWAKGVVLNVLISHQAHHRGQITVLMRQAGLKPPSVYGPIREEWAAMNMEAMV